MTIDKIIDAIREHFEANMIDGQDIDDCGKAMIDAKHVLEYIQEFYNLKTLQPEKPEVCKACYGKGKYSVCTQEIGADDFGGEGYTKSPVIREYPCPKCGGKSEEKGEEICMRCGLERKTVREEGSNGCYVYGDKVADRHMWKSQENREEIAEFLVSLTQANDSD